MKKIWCAFLEMSVGNKFLRNAWLILGGGALVLWLVLTPEMVYAASSAGGGETLKSFAATASLMIRFMVVLFLLLVQYGGDLLGTELITGDQIMEALLPMWRFFRNITNIGFVFVFLFLAASNLYASFAPEGKDSWTIKEKLPKVIFAMIAVNFSLLMFRVAIDFVHVGTIGLLSISDQGIEQKNINELLSVPTTEAGARCEAGQKEKDGKECKPWREWINGALCKDPKKKDEGAVCIMTPEQLMPLEPATATQKNIFLAFAVHFQHLEGLPILASQLGNLTDVSLNILFSFILSAAFIVAMVAVLIALIIRMVVLWFLMIVSPLLVASAILGLKMEGDADVSKHVMGNLVMPLKVAAAFSLSFVLISGMTGDDFQLMHQVEFVEAQSSVGQLLGPNMYGLLWKIATIVIFWMSVKWALKDSVGGAFITEKVMGAAESAGKFMVESATIDRPIFPGGGSIGSVMGMLDKMKSVKADEKRVDDAQFYENMGVTKKGEVEKMRSGNALRSATRGRNPEERGNEIDAHIKARGLTGMDDKAILDSSKLSDVQKTEFKELLTAAKGGVRSDIAQLEAFMKTNFANQSLGGYKLAAAGPAAAAGGAASTGQTTTVPYDTNAAGVSKTDVNYKSENITNNADNIRVKINNIKDANDANDANAARDAAMTHLQGKLKLNDDQLLKLASADLPQREKNAKELAKKIAEDMDKGFDVGDSVTSDQVTELNKLTKRLLDKRREQETPNSN